MSLVNTTVTLLAIGLLTGTVVVPVFAQSPVVQPKTLMTAQERSEYRQAMKGAHTPEAKQQIREQKYAQLRQRATERGMVMAEPNMGVPGMRWSKGYHENPGSGEGRSTGDD